MANASASCCGEATSADSVKDGFSALVPGDKRLSDGWRESLVARGNPEVFSGSDLRYIGMPVGGICCGQVYLGGDGKLWHWDIFKSCGGTDEPIDPRGYHYAKPLEPGSPLEQGFAIKVRRQNGKSTVRSLDASGYSDIQFEGRYPIGNVRYPAGDTGLEVQLRAYSPFIPLDENDSGLPVVVLEYEISNTSQEEVSVTIFGWLENKICRYDDKSGLGIRRNSVELHDDVLSLQCFADPSSKHDPSSLDGFGDMTLALLDHQDGDRVVAIVDHQDDSDIHILACDQLLRFGEEYSDKRPFGRKTIGALGRDLVLEAGQQRVVRFAVSWFFPRYTGGYVFHSTMEDLPGLEKIRRHYAARFSSSREVITYLNDNFAELAGKTQLWVDTWYDSTLPYWVLTRTFANTSTLATQTCHRFDDGRFYAWEGVDCCPGTCQHVWQYAQTIARLFPGLERWVREHVDYGIAYRSDGSIEYRAEANSGEIDMKSENDAEAFFASDGQLGTILRVFREHTMSSNSEFLTRLWPRVKKSLQFMMTLDTDRDGLLDAPQYHTLDTSWRGQIPWISSLYLAALTAGKQMADEMGDHQFALDCANRLAVGRENIVGDLFNGEYFVHRPDPDYPESMDLTQGSYIDQVFGQGYAMQLGLERVIPRTESVSALNSLWKYNFTPDVSSYREGFTEIQGGRWYAMPGEGGLLMCTWPKGDCNRADFEQKILGLDVTSEGYLNECMTGFEYQVASHMIAEGLVEKGLAITRTIHDRYHPSKRNPWNEVECSDHYSRAMASYGVFLNVCGFHYHGPNQHIEFAPKVTPDNFRAPFTTAEGWGTYQQIANSEALTATILLKYGRLDLNSVQVATGSPPTHVVALVDGVSRECAFSYGEDKDLLITFERQIALYTDSTLTLSISWV